MALDQQRRIRVIIELVRCFCDGSARRLPGPKRNATSEPRLPTIASGALKFAMPKIEPAKKPSENKMFPCGRQAQTADEDRVDCMLNRHLVEPP